MSKTNPFGAHSTADQVIAGIDLTGKHILVTGCNSGLGFETMTALTANGAHVIGLARTLDRAQAACTAASPSSTAIQCDLADLESVAAAAATIRRLNLPLDAIVANAGVASLSELQTGHGVERQFMVNHVAHFALINALVDTVRDSVGRIVVVSAAASKSSAPAEGIMFDNLDGCRYYKSETFYGQSKLANALYAKELSRRLRHRGISVNSLHPGATKGTGLYRHLRLPARIALSTAHVFMRDKKHGAATQTLLAASPRVAGLTGHFWSNCQIADANPLVEDADLAMRLWNVSADIVAPYSVSDPKFLREAA